MVRAANVFKGQQKTVCAEFNGVGSCDPGNNILITDSLNLLGTNFYVDPAFNGETDLLTNRLGQPITPALPMSPASSDGCCCTGTLTVPSVINDFDAQCSTSSGKRLSASASVTCVASDPDYPLWLKGVVYLQVHWINDHAESRIW